MSEQYRQSTGARWISGSGEEQQPAYASHRLSGKRPMGTYFTPMVSAFCTTVNQSRGLLLLVCGREKPGLARGETGGTSGRTSFFLKLSGNGLLRLSLVTLRAGGTDFSFFLGGGRGKLG